MLDFIAPASGSATALLVLCFVLVLVFEFSNGFHDTANAVATVIYTKALDPVPAVIWSGVMNFLGVLLGGIAVAYTLVDLIPADALTPPDGNPAIAMLLSLFLSALVWNVATWYFGLPCSSSHAIIGAILGVALADAVNIHRPLGTGVDWAQVKSVGEALLFSPLAGFLLAGGMFLLLRRLVRDRRLHEAPSEEDGKRPPLWLRGLLILTCGGVSFAHGSNDGQKNIGLIMLTIIGLMPAQYALNGKVDPAHLPAVAEAARAAGPLIEQRGDDRKAVARVAAGRLADTFAGLKRIEDIPPERRRLVRADTYEVEAELKRIASAADAAKDAATSAQALRLRVALRPQVEYVPVWVRVLSALCLGVGTMIGYRRVVRTIGERIGRQPMTPAQGASAEIVGAVLIATAGAHGLPVSTTHIVSAGVAGTMAAAGAGLQRRMVSAIMLAWLLTLPTTMVLAGGLFLLLR